MRKDSARPQGKKLARPYRVTSSDFRLEDVDPADTGPLDVGDKPHAEEELRRGIEALAKLQGMLYAQDRCSLLVIFQAMDAAGKDSAIKHVMTGLNPQGCRVAAFKAPSAEELDHDFLWRCVRELPARGSIGIFNRSYYEEVLVVRVHPEILAAQKLPAGLEGDDLWKHRYASIRDFEKHLHRNGTRVLKFFLHVSRAEQKRRFLERLEQPEKNWKFSAADLSERALWKRYMSAYEKMVRATATPESPWYVVPADHKWYTRVIVAAAMVQTLESMDLAFPTLDRAQRAKLAAIRKGLLAES